MEFQASATLPTSCAISPRTCGGTPKRSSRAWSATWRRSASAARCARLRAGSSMPRDASARRWPTTPPRKAARWCAVTSWRISPPSWSGCAQRSIASSAVLLRLLRLIRIFAIAVNYGLHEFMPRVPGDFVLRLLAGRKPEPRGQRLREAFEELGPMFVKFGQVLSTRRDLLPLDIADELAKLQDRVPPFPSELAVAEIERSLNRRIDEVFKTFQREPTASASIAQVHLAVLHDGREVAVKVLRPRVEEAIAKDVALLETAAALAERLWAEGRRLKPRQVVAEFERHLGEELDLMREAAHASQLRRNFAASTPAGYRPARGSRSSRPRSAPSASPCSPVR